MKVILILQAVSPAPPTSAVRALPDLPRRSAPPQRFSPCSLRSINLVLKAKSSRCFTEPEESFCGNLRVEGDEECDAGLVGSEDEDACCDKNCKLRRKAGAVCSDKNSPCCSNCQYLQMGVKCREASLATCEMEAKCNGARGGGEGG